MALRDFQSLFSRYFAVGYFVPCFFGFTIAAVTFPSGRLPDAYQRVSPKGLSATGLLVIGGVALFTALMLLGTNRVIVEFVSGQDLDEHKDAFGLRTLHRVLVGWQHRRYQRVVSTSQPPHYRLNERFPAKHRLLPSGLGNAERAAREWPLYQWGLDTTPAWYRIEALLPESERELHWNALSDREFFLNSSLLSLALGLTLIVLNVIDDREWHVDWYIGWALLLVAYPLYRGAVEATIRWGRHFKSSVDLHRLELYDRLGVARPESNEEEREAVSYYVNRLLTEGQPVPEEYSEDAAPAVDAAQAPDELGDVTGDAQDPRVAITDGSAHRWSFGRLWPWNWRKKPDRA